MEGSLLVGKRVRYSVTKQEVAYGVVLDKIDMRAKPEDKETITGYKIECEKTGDLLDIAYWRVLKVCPTVKTKGGYRDN